MPSTIVVLEDEGECGPLLERRVGGAPPGAFGLWGGVTKTAGGRGLLSSALLHAGHPTAGSGEPRALRLTAGVLTIVRGGVKRFHVK